MEILYYTPYFKETLCQAYGFSPSLAQDLCTVTLDRGRLPQADAVLFHIPDVTSLPAKKAGQIWVAMTMESDANYPSQQDQHFMQHFDLLIKFTGNADIQTLYFNLDYDLPILQKAPRRKTGKAPAVYFASNNFALNNRYEFVAELKKHIKIDSYGKSQNNSKVADDTGRDTKIETISNYMFYLAFENSNSPDYVSEKLYDGLIAGTVPVYLGAGNVDAFLPAKTCIIKAEHFATAKELAQFLLRLTKNEREYESYLAWKKEPLQQSFIDLIEPEYTPRLRRLCAKLHELLAARRPELQEA